MKKNINNDIDLSIIIPVFNGEKYLKRCLESITFQLNDKTELIIVDDGSTDSSSEIYKNFIKNSNNIFYYYKDNGGVSSARNYGMKKSKGKYVTFIDCDDYVSNNFVKKIFSEIINDIDILFFQYNSDDVMDKTFDFSKTINQNIENDVIIKSTFLAKEPIDKCRYNFRSVWSKVIRKDIIEDNNILFPENISFGEDMVFMLNIYSNIKNKKFIPDVLYHNFFLHESSATNSYKPNMANILKNQSEAILNWMNRYNCNEYLPYHAFLRLDDIILLIKYDFYNKKNNEKIGEKNKRFKKLIENFGYKSYYKLLKQNNLLHLYKKNKLFVIRLALYKCFLLLNIVAKIKYK